MIYAVLGLIFLCGLIFSALIVHVTRSEDHLDRVLSAHAQQVSELADRIQHPETRHVEPGPVREYDPPTDEAELAQVGQIVHGNPDENGEAYA